MTDKVAEMNLGMTKKQAAERMKSKDYEREAAKADVLLDMIARAIQEGA